MVKEETTRVENKKKQHSHVSGVHTQAMQKKSPVNFGGFVGG